jgi:hypothetical protein
MADLDVGQSLGETLKRSDLASLSADYAEIGIDQLFDDGVLREIPVIGTLKALFNIGVGIRDHLFIKKLIRFLSVISDVPKEQRQRQIDEMDNSSEESKRVGETVMLLLDKANDMQKPALMAKAFRAYLLGEIDVTSLHRLWYAIDTIDVSYLQELAHIYQSEGYNEQDGTDVLPPAPEYHHLAICGLLMFDFGRLRGLSGPENETRTSENTVTKKVAKFDQGGFKKNRLGQLFVKTLLRN